MEIVSLKLGSVLYHDTKNRKSRRKRGKLEQAIFKYLRKLPIHTTSRLIMKELYVVRLKCRIVQLRVVEDDLQQASWTRPGANIRKRGPKEHMAFHCACKRKLYKKRYIFTMVIYTIGKTYYKYLVIQLDGVW